MIDGCFEHWAFCRGLKTSVETRSLGDRDALVLTLRKTSVDRGLCLVTVTCTASKANRGVPSGNELKLGVQEAKQMIASALNGLPCCELSTTLYCCSGLISDSFSEFIDWTYSHACSIQTTLVLPVHAASVGSDAEAYFIIRKLALA